MVASDASARPSDACRRRPIFKLRVPGTASSARGLVHHPAQRFTCEHLRVRRCALPHLSGSSASGFAGWPKPAGVPVRFATGPAGGRPCKQGRPPRDVAHPPDRSEPLLIRQIRPKARPANLKRPPGHRSGAASPNAAPEGTSTRQVDPKNFPSDPGIRRQADEHRFWWNSTSTARFRELGSTIRERTIKLPPPAPLPVPARSARIHPPKVLDAAASLAATVRLSSPSPDRPPFLRTPTLR